MNPFEQDFYRYSVPILTPILRENLKIQKSTKNKTRYPYTTIQNYPIFWYIYIYLVSFVFKRNGCLHIKMKSPLSNPQSTPPKHIPSLLHSSSQATTSKNLVCILPIYFNIILKTYTHICIHYWYIVLHFVRKV